MRIPRTILACLACWWPPASLVPGAEPAPRPVAAWASGPMEARVAFDRAVDPELARRVVGLSIGFGEGEKPGVVGRPGGDRGALRVAAARLVDEGRTLVLVTDPHPREARYQLTLPGVKAPGEPGAGARVDVTYDLGGVEVAFDQDGKTWSGWWPSTDPAAARQVTAGSAEHERLWSLTSRPGLLTLQTLVATPKGDVSLAVDASAPFRATFGIEMTRSIASRADAHRATLKAEATGGEPTSLALALSTVGGGPPRLRLAIGPGPLPRSAFVLPWAPPALSPSPPSAAPAGLLTGGDPARGEAVFFGEQARCSACHAVRGKGGAIGPDLSNLAGRDRAWLYQSIVEPSASIHPDYVSHTVLLKDGRVAMGVVRAEGADAIKVGDIEARQTTFPRAEVEEIRPSASSIMPVGLLASVGEDRARDLLAYLTAPKGPAR